MSEILNKIKQEMSNNIDKIIGQGQLDPKAKQWYVNTVTAGLKIMFEPETHANMELIKNPASRKNPTETISSGIAGLMWLMFQQSKKTMPTPILIMAGVTLMAEAIDFAERGLGIKFDSAMIAKTTQMVSEHLFTKLGISQEQLKEAVNKGRDEIIQHQGGQNNANPQEKGGIINKISHGSLGREKNPGHSVGEAAQGVL